MSQPNMILFTGEDIGRHQRCYGDRFAQTPNIDRLAAEGELFENAITTGPVCSPARSTIITGRYPTSIGTHNHRSKLLDPPRLFTEELRDAGYFVNWGNKTDFNFEPRESFADERSDWTETLETLGNLSEPFFLYYNFNKTHESRLWPPGAKALPEPFTPEPILPAEQLEGVPVPPFLPDTPITRSGLRRYYDNMAALDAKLGAIMDAVDKQGLAENTYIIFASDHGRGVPRGKRWLYEEGIHLPLVVRGPGLDAGRRREDLVSWVDFAPTILALGGADAADDLPGRVFLGPDAEAEPAAVFSGRDRMDEAYDRCRSARDRRFLLIQNDFPQRPWGFRQWYEETSPILQEMRELHAAGELRFPENVYFQETKPAIELYDTVTDPHCLHNLAQHPEYAETRNTLMQQLTAWREKYDTYGRQDERELVKQGLVADQTAEDAKWLDTLPEPYRQGGLFDTIQFPAE